MIMESGVIFLPDLGGQRHGAPFGGTGNSGADRLARRVKCDHVWPHWHSVSKVLGCGLRGKHKTNSVARAIRFPNSSQDLAPAVQHHVVQFDLAEGGLESSMASNRQRPISRPYHGAILVRIFDDSFHAQRHIIVPVSLSSARTRG